MYGLWAYGGSGRTFDTKASAQTFDTRRFTDVSYANACPPATSSQCTLVEVTRANYALGSGVLWWLRARPSRSTPAGCTSTARSVLQSCSWLRLGDEDGDQGAMGGSLEQYPPTGSTAATRARPASGADGLLHRRLPLAPSQACGNYGATGSNLYQAAVRNSPAPPQNPMPRIVVTAGGQVKYSSLQMDAGSQPQSTTLGYRDAITELLYYLEVPRDLHTCRHVDPTTCK
jgi:type IV pilus assembly protein PilY1